MDNKKLNLAPQEKNGAKILLDALSAVAEVLCIKSKESGNYENKTGVDFVSHVFYIRLFI